MAQRGSSAGIVALLVGCGLIVLVAGGAAVMYVLLGAPDQALPSPADQVSDRDPAVAAPAVAPPLPGAMAPAPSPWPPASVSDDHDAADAARGRELAALRDTVEAQRQEGALLKARLDQLEERLAAQEKRIPELVREQLPAVTREIERERAHQTQVSALTARLDNLRGVLPELTDAQILTVKTVMQEYYQSAFEIRNGGQDASLINARLDEARRLSEAQLQAALGDTAFQQARERGVINFP